MQSEIRILAQAPYFLVIGAVVLTTMASSAQVMRQPRMITSWQESGSIPSLLGPRSLFSMRIPSISTFLQPAKCSVQKAASKKVTSRTVRLRTSSKKLMRGRKPRTFNGLSWLPPSASSS